MRIYRKLHDFYERLNMTLHSMKLTRLNPILAVPNVNDYKEDGYLYFYYPNTKLYKQPEFDGYISTKYDHESRIWHILTSQKIVIMELEVDETPVEIYRANDSSIPVYVRVFFDLAQDLFKDSLITIEDDLPYDFSAKIRPIYNYRRNKEAILRFIARSIFKVDEVEWIPISHGDQPLPRNYDQKEEKQEDKKEDAKVEAFLSKNKRKSFRKAIDELIKLTGKPIKSNLSYCLACGHGIAKKKKFCDSTKEGYSMSGKDPEIGIRRWKDNCRNKFDNW